MSFMGTVYRDASVVLNRVTLSVYFGALGECDGSFVTDQTRAFAPGDSLRLVLQDGRTLDAMVEAVRHNREQQTVTVTFEGQEEPP